MVRVPAAHAYNNGVVCGWIDRWSIRKGSRRLRYSNKVFEDTLACAYVGAAECPGRAIRVQDDVAEAEDAIRDEVLASVEERPSGAGTAR